MNYSLWKNIKIKRCFGGCGDVTEEEKRAIVGKADSDWKKIGLSHEQRAFGIAVMNVESGFNASAKNPDHGSTAYGLGQLTDPTWEDAVKYYNDKFRGKNEFKIYPDVSRSDTDAQIKAMGAWIQKVWERTKKLAVNPKLKDYNFMEIAYGVWHEGVYAKADDLKNTKGGITPGIKTFLAGEFSHTSLRTYLNATYVEAHDAIDIKDILSKIRSSGGTGTKNRPIQPHAAGEKLQRHGNEVWRIRPDGSARGYFLSE